MVVVRDLGGKFLEVHTLLRNGRLDRKAEGKRYSMIIKSGYWNYYMSFRISDNKKLFRDIYEKNYADTVIGFAAEGKVLESKEAIENYLQVRRRSMDEILKRKNRENWSTQTERQMYRNNELPEYYFDFVQQLDGYIDNLQVAYGNEIAEIHECNQAIINMTRECNKTSWQILSLMPLKVEKKPFKYEFCPVHLYLFENGQAVIKTSISIEDVDAKIFSTFPMPTWFGNIKAWEAAIQCGGRKEYKICETRDQKISIVTHILQNYVYRLFNGNLLGEKRFGCFETFVIAEMKEKQIWEIAGKGSAKEKEELYQLVNPEEFMTQVTSERWHEFWKSSYEYFNGIDFVKGHNCRLIITMDMDKLKRQYRRSDVEDTGKYFNISMQRSFDFFLVVALCQKDGELYLASVSNDNIHDIEKQIARYNQNCNFFEMFLDTVPYNARKFYSMIRGINDDSFIDVKTRIERIQQVNAYQRSMLVEKRTLIAEEVALIGTVLFGLPTLYNTLMLLKITFLSEADLIKENITQFLAVFIWGILILTISKYLVKAYKEYLRKKI